MESFIVVEADPVEDLVLCVLEGGEAAAVDELCLEGRDPRLAIALSYASPLEPTDGSIPSSSSRSV